MPDENANVIRFVTAQEKRRAEEVLAFERLWGADACQKILAATIGAFRRSGYSNEEIVNTLRFGKLEIDLLANVRVLARPEQDPWTFHWRGSRQRRCGRQARGRRDSFTRLERHGP